MIDQIPVASLIPEQYAEFRPIVSKGLADFINALSRTRRESMSVLLESQTDSLHAVAALLSCCPTLHKLGQIMARDRRLDVALRQRLQFLESAPFGHWSGLPDLEPSSHSSVHGTIIIDEPLAEGSVARVVSAHFEQQVHGFPSRFVLKMLKPGVASLIDEELTIWRALAPSLTAAIEEQGLGFVPLGEVLDDVAELILAEINLDAERTNIDEARQAYASDAFVKIPETFAIEADGVLAMERLDGEPLTTALSDPSNHGVEFARQLARSLLVAPFCSIDSISVFHGDPHGGNILLLPDSRIGLLDWSMVARLGKAERSNLAHLVLAANCYDADSACDALRSLTADGRTNSDLHRVVRDSIATRHAPLFLLSDLVAMLDRCVRKAGVRFGSDMMVLRKSLKLIDGVCHDLAPAESSDAGLAAAVMEELMSEFPSRTVCHPSWPCPRTHLSNLDIANALWMAPYHFSQLMGQRWLEAWFPPVSRRQSARNARD